MLPLVSIIIPSYNRAQIIGETLNSVLLQTYLNWECILVDDHSTDHTEELINFYIEKDSRFSYFQRPESKLKGANSCRNYGFELSRGNYIQWFDSDDLMHPELLEEKINYLNKNPQKDYCLSQMTAFKGFGKTREFIKTTSIDFKNLFEDYVTGKMSAGTPSILWRKKILLQQELLFDNSLKNSQDLDFHSRIFFINNRIGVLPKSLVFFRIHKQTISKDFLALKGGHLNSFLEVRRRILKLDPENEVINASIMSSVLGMFRTCLTRKNYTGCDLCLSFVKRYNLNDSSIFSIRFLRIKFFYQIFKFIGRGDTRFRLFLKIKMNP